jgi:hypothetical protein
MEINSHITFSDVAVRPASSMAVNGAALQAPCSVLRADRSMGRTATTSSWLHAHDDVSRESCPQLLVHGLDW